MATVTRENIANITDKLTVNLTKEDYYNSFEQNLKKYAKTANIPGFRKGHVPMGMIKKQYETAVTAEEVNKLLQESLNNYIQEEKLGIRLENDYLITNDGAVNLMYNIPIEVEEIENKMNR